jgi:serine-type D-Ala-D-Ala carboxypeptidase/endopeptidase (penicillin-binding protein 4)
MSMKKIFFTLLAITVSFFAAGQVTPGITFSDAVFHDNTSWSICVADAVTGEIITDKDASRNLIPASIMKLIPTAAALTLLGEDYRFTTTMGFSGNLNIKKGELKGDIIILGGGDPMLGSPLFSDSYGDITGNWARIIRETGIKKIRGNILADASIYDYQPIPGGWEWEDIGNYYGTGIHGLNFYDNSFNIYFTSREEGSKPIIDSVDIAGRYIDLTNYLISEGNSDNGFVFSLPFAMASTLEGTLSTNSNTVLCAALPDPPLATALLLKNRLTANGIQVTGDATTRRVRVANDSVLEIISAIISPSIKELVFVTNQESINLYAGQLCKHLGLVYRGKGSFNEGIEMLKSFLDTIGCKTSEVHLADPAGLSRNNVVCASLMVKLLIYMYNSPNRSAFVASLPVAGVSGTLKNSFRDEVFKDRMIAKTGSMTGVKSYAGYVTGASGKVMAFTIMVNGYTTSGSEVTDKIEEIIKSIILNY